MRNKCIFLFSTINLPTTTACGICNTSRSFLPVRKIPFYARLRPSGCHAPTSADAPSVSARPLLQLQPSRSNFAFVPIRFVRRIIFKQVFACLNTFRSLRIIWPAFEITPIRRSPISPRSPDGTISPTNAMRFHCTYHVAAVTTIIIIISATFVVASSLGKNITRIMMILKWL